MSKKSKCKSTRKWTRAPAHPRAWERWNDYQIVWRRFVAVANCLEHRLRQAELDANDLALEGEYGCAAERLRRVASLYRVQP